MEGYFGSDQNQQQKNLQRVQPYLDLQKSEGTALDASQGRYSLDLRTSILRKYSIRTNPQTSFGSGKFEPSQNKYSEPGFIRPSTSPKPEQNYSTPKSREFKLRESLMSRIESVVAQKKLNFSVNSNKSNSSQHSDARFETNQNQDSSAKDFTNYFKKQQGGKIRPAGGEQQRRPIWESRFSVSKPELGLSNLDRSQQSWLSTDKKKIVRGEKSIEKNIGYAQGNSVSRLTSLFKRHQSSYSMKSSENSQESMAISNLLNTENNTGQVDGKVVKTDQKYQSAKAIILQSKLRRQQDLAHSGSQSRENKQNYLYAREEFNNAGDSASSVAKRVLGKLSYARDYGSGKQRPKSKIAQKLGVVIGEKSSDFAEKSGPKKLQKSKIALEQFRPSHTHFKNPLDQKQTHQALGEAKQANTHLMNLALANSTKSHSNPSIDQDLIDFSDPEQLMPITIPPTGKTTTQDILPTSIQAQVIQTKGPEDWTNPYFQNLDIDIYEKPLSCDLNPELLDMDTMTSKDKSVIDPNLQDQLTFGMGTQDKIDLIPRYSSPEFKVHQNSSYSYGEPLYSQKTFLPNSDRLAESLQVGSDSNGSISFEIGKGLKQQVISSSNEDHKLIDVLLDERQNLVARLSW